jgi:uncharacterized protein
MIDILKLLSRLLDFRKPLERQQKEYKGKILVIGGGEIFNNYDSYLTWLRALELREQTPSWKSWLAYRLDQHNLEVIRVGMPNTFNAQYEEWQIMFSKYFVHIDNNTSMVGHSLGAMFLLKFLAEHPEIETKVKSVHLVSPSFYDAYTFEIPLDYLPNSNKYFFYQSYDDEVVTWNNSITKTVQEQELSDNYLHIFEDRGHFLQPEFEELLNCIVDNY